MKKLLIPVVLLSFFLLISSCALWDMLTETYINPADMGTYLSVDYEQQVECSIDTLYPSGVVFAAGNTVTASITQNSGQYRYWDTDINTWDSWSDITDLEKELRTYIHMGTYIISLSGTDWLPYR